jgi:hypothetical protein
MLHYPPDTDDPDPIGRIILTSLKKFYQAAKLNRLGVSELRCFFS